MRLDAVPENLLERIALRVRSQLDSTIGDN